MDSLVLHDDLCELHSMKLFTDQGCFYICEPCDLNAQFEHSLFHHP